MKKLVIYVHGKGGNKEESAHFIPLFTDYDVVGFDYKATTPWKAKTEFLEYFNKVSENYGSVIVIANSIGAYFTMHALLNSKIEKAYFISPIVDMEKLILQMMSWANVTEETIKARREIKTDFGETLSWQYLTYVRENPILWRVPTHILYGEKDNLTPYDVMNTFAKSVNATLDVMPDGEHWFHTQDQTSFLDKWILKYKN